MLKLSKISVNVPPGIKDYLSDFIFSLETTAVSEDGNNANGYTVSALFPIERDLEPIVNDLYEYMNFLNTNISEFEIDKIKIEHIDRSSWEIWKNELKRVRAGRTVLITPPWELNKCESHEHLIIINPSMAFGTGHHETTRLCIEYIEKLSELNKLNNMLDVGCGSAVLSIAGIKLGIKSAVCFDIDPVAVREARSNVKRNNETRSITYFCGSIGSLRGIYDLIVANISVEALILMGNEFYNLLSDTGYLVLSGIPSMRKTELTDGVGKAGFKVIEEKTDGEWTGIVFRKRIEQDV